MTPRDAYEVVWSGSSKLSLTDGALFLHQGFLSHALGVSGNR